MQDKFFKYRKDLIIGKIILYISVASIAVGAVYGVVRNQDYSFLGVFVIIGLLYVLALIFGRSHNNYVKLMTSLPSDHKLITDSMTAVDVGNFRFIYRLYGKGSTFSLSNRTYLSLSVPIPFPLNDNEAEMAITEDVEELIRNLKSEDVLTDAVTLAREDEDDDTKWAGQPLFMEFLFKGITSDWLIALQNKIVDIINRHHLQDLQYCTIRGTEDGTVFSMYNGNLFCSSVFKDAFDSSLWRRYYKMPYGLTQTVQDPFYDIGEYISLYEAATDSKGDIPFDDLEKVIKIMFKGLGSKTVVKISYEENGIRTYISIPSKMAASDYNLTYQSGYWWIYAQGRLDNINPMSAEDEYTACEMYLKFLERNRMAIYNTLGA